MPTQSPASKEVPAQQRKDPETESRLRRQELLSKARLVREKIDMNRRAVTGREDMHYCWVNRNDHRQVEFQSLGYTMVSAVDTEVKTSWRREDGTHQCGDAILYQCPKEWYDALQVDQQIRSLEALDQYQSGFFERLSDSGSQPYKPNVKE